jgi:apolipoprotein N-acyltransferase
MPKTLPIRIGLQLFAPLVGAFVAQGLRGEWNALLLVAFTLSLSITSFSVIALAEDFVFHLLLALGFYGVAFKGLLGPSEGGFGGLWFVVSLLLSLFQACSVLLSSLLVKNNSCRVFLLSFAVVGWEFIRHHMTKLYDGAGLTFCLLGQSVASDFYLLQSADLGGVWLLSFYCAALGTAISVWFVPRLSVRFRVGCTSIVAFVFVAGYGYGYVCVNIPDKASSRDSMLVYVCDQFPDLRQLEAVNDSIKSHDFGTPTEIVVVYPETCCTWQKETVTPEQFAMSQLSRMPCVSVVTGAWYPAKNGLHRNVCALIRDGEVQLLLDKLHLVPIVESCTLGERIRVLAG